MASKEKGTTTLAEAKFLNLSCFLLFRYEFYSSDLCMNPYAEEPSLH
jgi:hypothetical protein